jgi:uncharacterized protein YggE
MIPRRWLAFLALAASCAVQASPLPDYPFVSTGGRAQAWMPPDIGELQFDVGAQQPSAGQAAAALQAQCASIAPLLASHGIGEADVEGYELGKKAVELTNPGADGATQAWSLGRHYRVQVRDLSQWPALLTEVMALDHVDGVSVQFDRSDRERVNALLLAEAAKDARSNGALLAESFGRKLGPVVAIARAPLEKVGAPFMEQPEAAASSVPRGVGVQVTESTVLQYTVPLSIPFAQSVSAVFRLK